MSLLFNGPALKRPTEKLLVISENQELSLYLKNEIERNLFEHPLTVDFCYTSFKHPPPKMIDIGAKPINVKNEETIDRIIKSYDLVFSLHCKQIFPKRLVENVCCINFHPGYNPFNRGWFPQAFSITNGLPTGATIHLMNVDVDHGDIIDQKKVQVGVSDTSLEVYMNIIRAEKALIHKNIFDIIEGSVKLVPPIDDGNYNSFDDYKALCELNLKSVGSLGEHIDLLRATSHGNFKNAYFTDENNKKFYIRVVIEEES